jgi:hypothetical protein
MGGSMRPIQQNKEALAVASKQIGLEVNASNAEYVVMSRDEHAGQNNNITLGNRSFGRAEQFRYLENLKKSIRERIRANWSWGLLAIIWCNNICLPSCCPKI